MAVTTKSRSQVNVRKLHPHIGAEIEGVDLKAALDDASFAAIEQAFNAHSVLVFRDQDIDDEQHVAFSARFGPLEETTFKVASENPYVYSLSNVDDDGNVLALDAERRTFLEVNERWHTDSSFRVVPAMGSLLSAKEVPEKEGDTEFASMRVGYQTLPDERKRALERLVGVHSYAYSLSLFGSKHGVTTDELDTVPPAEHPLVRTHPGTGAKNLFVSGHIEHIKGVPVEEGRALVKELIDWCTRPAYVYRHQWRRHDLVMWDNRCALHRATTIPETQRRIMHRTTIAGEGPVV